MSVVSQPVQQADLHSGDRMSRAEFHRIYETMPEEFRAELIGGTVFVPSPLKRRHGISHPFLTSLFVAYAARTSGVECGDNVTIVLAEDSEPQPDLYLRILPEYGGQSGTTEDDYVEGPPELVAEIAHSSRALDLHGKYEDYARYGVREYLVLSLEDNQLRWFDLQVDCELQVEKDGILRMRTFPGLWIHRDALLAKDHQRLMETLEQGLSSPEHGDFIKRLQQAAQ